MRKILAIAGALVLFGHSYGGAVTTNAATGNSNVKALVYVAAYGLDAGSRWPPRPAQGPGRPAPVRRQGAACDV